MLTKVAALLAICGGYQISGDTWLMGAETVEGLDLINVTTKRAGTGFDRLIDNIALKSLLGYSSCRRV